MENEKQQKGKQQQQKGNPAPVEVAAAQADAPAVEAAEVEIDEQMHSSRVQIEALPEEPNRFKRLFEGFSFKVTDADRIYDNSDGTQSKRIANGVCVYRGGFAATPFTVYAKTKKGTKKVIAEVSFVGTRQQQALMPLDEASKAELNEYKAFLASEYAKWRKSQPAATVKSVTGVTLDDADGLFAAAE